MVDLLKNLKGEDLKKETKAFSLEILRVKIDSKIDKGSKKQKINELLRNFNEKIKDSKHFDFFKKMKPEQQITALVNTAFVLILK